MKYFFLVFATFLFLSFSGCGYKEGASAGDQVAYLYFSGNTKGVTVSVDNSTLSEVKAGIDNQYKIKPGKHTIRVYRKGKIIVNREIYVGDNIAKEIGLD